VVEPIIPSRTIMGLEIDFSVTAGELLFYLLKKCFRFFCRPGISTGIAHPDPR